MFGRKFFDLFGRKQPRRRATFRPEFIQLEDRVVPTTSMNLLSNNFAGVTSSSDSGHHAPPDTQLAVGPALGVTSNAAHPLGLAVEAVNDQIAIYDKGTGQLVSQQTIQSIFGNYDTSFMTDPQILYDDSAGRFVLEVLDVPYLNDKTTKIAYVDIVTTSGADPTLGFTSGAIQMCISSA